MRYTTFEALRQDLLKSMYAGNTFAKALLEVVEEPNVKRKIEARMKEWRDTHGEVNV